MGIIQDTIGCSKNRKGKQLDQINKKEIGPKKITVENTNRRSKNKERQDEIKKVRKKNITEKITK